MPKPVASATHARRSPCPVACSLDLFGDRWTLLVIRDLFLGQQRFKEFVASPEGIPTNVLSDRLERLRKHGIVELTDAADGSKHPAYQLTAKGQRALTQEHREWNLFARTVYAVVGGRP